MPRTGWIVLTTIGVAAVLLSVFTAMGSSKAVTTASGLKYTDEVVGSGETAKLGKMVAVHYTGRFKNGEKFDSSHDRGEPLQFPLGTPEIIKGWNEGIAGMKVGGKRKLIVPSELAYGARGRDGIPPNSELHFDIELLGVK